MKKVLTPFILLLCINLSFSQANCDDKINFKDPLGQTGSYPLPNDVVFETGSRLNLGTEKCEISLSSSYPDFDDALPTNPNNHFISYEIYSGNTYLKLNDKNPNSNDGDDFVYLRSKFNDIENSTIHLTALLEMQDLHNNNSSHPHSINNPITSPYFRIIIKDVITNEPYAEKCIESSDLDLNPENTFDQIYRSSGFQTFSIEVPPSANGRDVYVDFIVADCSFSLGLDYAMAYVESICLENDSHEIIIPDDPCDALSVNITTELPDCNIFENSDTFNICGNFTALASGPSPILKLNIINNSGIFGTSTILIPTTFDTVNADGLGSGTFCITLNENNFNVLDEYEIYANIHFWRKLNCSKITNAYNLPLEPCTSEPDCGITINNIGEYNWLGQYQVAFVANVELALGWNITSSSFEVTYQDGSIATFDGYLNTEGTPQILIPVNCDTGSSVTNVTATVFASDTYGVNCSSIRAQRFRNVCGTGGFSFNITRNPVKDILNIEIDQSAQLKEKVNEIVILNLKGNIEINHYLRNENKVSLDVSELSKGLYFVKLVSNGEIIESKKIIISD
nr:T9SS type A sorting domain-containing protein [uncultured Psychroserpens sp.]